MYVLEESNMNNDVVQILFTREALEFFIELFNKNNVRTNDGLRVTIEQPKYELTYGSNEYTHRTQLVTTVTVDMSKPLSN